MHLENLNLNIFNIIIISGVIHGLIFSFFVFTQDKNLKKSTVYLGLTVLFLSLSNFQYWLIDTQITYNYPFLKYIFIPWHWLVLPMFYLYVFKLTHKNKVSSTLNTLLLGPFTLVVLIHLSHLFYKFFIDSSYVLSSHFERGIYVYLEFISFIFNLTLMFLSYKIIKNYEEDNSYDIRWVKTETNWLKKLIYLGIFICICWLIAIVIVSVYNLHNTHYFYPMWIGNSILVYWIGYVGISKSKQLKERIALRKKTNLSKENDLKNTSTFSKLELQIIDNKLYLNPNLNLHLLSKNFNLSEGYISQQINSNSGMNFNDFINQLRINEAKEMLTKNSFNNYTIESIGLESGFNSKSSFYVAFKKFTNKTPVEYKKAVRNL